MSEVIVVDRELPEYSKTTIQRGIHTIADGDKLLDELLKEDPSRSAAPLREEPQPRPKSGTKHSKKKHGSPEDDLIPPWLEADLKRQPQVEQLLPVAEKYLERVIDELVLIPQSQWEDAVHQQINQAIALATNQVKLERASQKIEQLAHKELSRIFLGRGPLDELFEDSAVTTIYIDSFRSIKAVRKDLTIDTPFSFRSSCEYLLFVKAALHRVGLSLSAGPVLDLIFPDETQSRVNVLGPAVLEGGEHRMCIRIPRTNPLSFYDVLQLKFLPPGLAAWLAEAVSSQELGILVAGPSDSGKTSMLSALLSACGSTERVLTIEELPEITVPGSYHERLIIRAGSAGGLPPRELVRAATRRAAQRIVVGQLQGEEASELLKVGESGVVGLMAAIPSSSSEDALWRLLDLVQTTDHTSEESTMRRISRTFQLVVLMRRIDGVPCVVEVSEISPVLKTKFVLQPIVRYLGTRDGRRQWQITGAPSRIVEMISSRGMALRESQGLLGLEGSPAA